MPYKVCPSCAQISYSAAAVQIWFCPCCGKDLSLARSVYDPQMLAGLRRRPEKRPSKP
ncbi:MAG: hypothetical protein Q4B96_00960 [Bacillota bacterium]|nr:hypothetical protein [Bacillota bacterium]